ncbi:uncharacterized protein LOC122512761 isoform X2 [Leptopilina heterotoma]|uniref:uncharacterized protein LOC122512761 isoform X2 n=1 Tax=Leptopilina heterotoma TaxID=63436 RepID=UPI001CA98B5B|nr:uncharacterized protein LOC122512761 isoform X2 [Leptopilina heterotoma]
MNVNVKVAIVFLFWIPLFMVLNNIKNDVTSSKVNEAFLINSKDHGKIQEVNIFMKIIEDLKLKFDLMVHETIFGVINYWNKFYNSDSIKNLISTILRCTTDALITLPLMTKIVSFENNLQCEVTKKSLPLVFSISQGIIITEILNFLIKPTLAGINFPPERRRYNYITLQIRKNITLKHFQKKKYNKVLAMDILDNYVFDSYEDLFIFGKKITEGSEGSEFHKCSLHDSNLYEKLRFEGNIENKNCLNLNLVIKRIHNIYSREEINLINLRIKRLFFDYVENDLFDTVSFDDYYAIQDFLTNNYITTNLSFPSLWRIKKAMYSLALRQFDAISSTASSTETLYCLPKNDSKRITDNGFLTFDEFIICHNDLSNVDNYGIQFNNNPSTRIYKLIIKQLFLVVHLKIIDKDLNSYVIFPGTEFMGVYDNNTVIIGENSVPVVTLESVTVKNCEWLANVANKASHFVKLAKNPVIEEEEYCV